MKKKEVTISRANSKKERKSLKNGLRKRSTVANIPLPKSQEAEKQDVDRSNSAPSKSGQTVRYADSHIVDLTIDNNKISKLLVHATIFSKMNFIALFFPFCSNVCIIVFHFHMNNSSANFCRQRLNYNQIFNFKCKLVFSEI